MTNTAEIIQFPRRDDVDRPELERSGRGPQVEDGYTRIADELYKVINNRHTFPGTATHLRIVHAIIVRTYGFNKTMDYIADTQLAADTGIPRQKVNPAKLQLLSMRVLVLSPDGRKIGVNKHHSEWDFSARPEKKAPQRKAIPKGDSVTKKVTPSVTDSGTHNREIDNLLPNGSKNTSAKTSSAKRRQWGEPIDHELAEWMAGIVDALPGGSEKRNLTLWANTIRLMREQDNREPEHIKRLFEWATQDDFWQSNILSPTKLRKQWKTLAIQFNSRRKGGSHADRQGFDQQRSDRDRVAAMLADPYDTSWAEGLLDEESGDMGTGEPSVYEAGGDLPQNVENSFHDAGNGQAGEAGSGCIDGEVVGTAYIEEPGCSTGTDQGRGQRVAAECGEADSESETSAGGLWYA